MQFDIGHLKLTAHLLLLYEGYLPLMVRAPFNQWGRSRLLFNWDCRTQTGDRPQPLKPLITPCYLHFDVTDDDGNPDPVKAGAMLDRFVAVAGFKTRQEFSDAFSQVCPDISSPIDEATLITPHKQNYSFDVRASADYDIFVVTANGGHIGDHAFLAVPRSIFVQTVWLRSCKGAPRPAFDSLGSGSVKPATNELQVSLREQAVEDATEATRRIRERH